MKNNNLKNENEIKVIQLNPKFRLFLLVLFSWFVIPFPIWFVPCYFLVPDFNQNEQIYLPVIIFCFLLLIFLYLYYFMRPGIRYLPKDLNKIYFSKNNHKFQKISNFEIYDITQLFNVVPICDEVYAKKQNYESRTETKFTKLSLIEASINRLVVNGKIKDLDFSWGVVTKMKKNNFKVFLLAILYFGPVLGILWGLIPKIIVNEDPAKVWKIKKSWKYMGPLILILFLFTIIIQDSPADFPGSDSLTKFEYKKFGVMDLFPNNVGKLNSENYLIFAAKLKNPSDLISLIPKNNTQQPINLDTQYEWPTNISLTQKMALQSLMKKMSFLPSIYLYQDTISIVMKKYHYNDQDNLELQTWELIKDPEADSEIQFNYLNQAIKIYQIFDKKEE